MKTEVLYGVHPVAEALRSRRRHLETVYVARGKPGRKLEEILVLARAAGVPVRELPPDALTARTGSPQHQGIGAEVGPLPLLDLESLLASLPTGRTAPFLILLDSVVDPNNLGALIRSALCAGADGVVIPKDRAAGPTPAVAKASAGALEHVPLVQVTNLANAIRILKKEGLWTAGLDAAGDAAVYDIDLTLPLGLVIGGEEKGIRPLVKSLCDFLLAIPQKGPLDSLNASAAGAVVMFEALRQREYGRRPSE